jgi:hypothetical protein
MMTMSKPTVDQAISDLEEILDKIEGHLVEVRAMITSLENYPPNEEQWRRLQALRARLPASEMVH